MPEVPRIVPGAPPPDPSQKSHKKRRKQKPLDPTDTNHLDSPATLAPEPETPTVLDELKLSPIVDLVNKRLKATSKKITRIAPYASTDPQELNDDQRRSVKSLPALEAIQKELAEVKKAIEAHEADLVHELIAKKLEAERAERARLADAAAVAQKTSVTKTIDILNLLRLHSLLASGGLDTLSTDQTEGSVIYAVADTLLGADDDKKKTLVENFLQGSGDFDGISYTRLVEITTAGLALPRVPTPPPAEETQEEVVVEDETALEVSVAGIPGGLPKSKEISFVQESEIEETNETQPADDGDWIDAGTAATDQIAQEEFTNGQVKHEAEQPQDQEMATSVVEESTTGAPLDWAADEGGLPSIASVQESFGASGGVSPADHGQAESTPEGANGHPNGSRPYRRSAHDEEGFTQARGGRGRGRGFRGFRGERRGRGGGFRGRGEGRGEGRGGYRGRGEWRGNGEHRGYGRGRGRGRGGERGAGVATGGDERESM